MILDYSTYTQKICEAYEQKLMNEAVVAKEEFINKQGIKIKLVAPGKNEYGEWPVKVYFDGKYNEDATNYTDSKEEAIAGVANLKKVYMENDIDPTEIKESNKLTNDIKVAKQGGINWMWYLAYRIVEGNKIEILFNDRAHRDNIEKDTPIIGYDVVKDSYKIIEDKDQRRTIKGVEINGKFYKIIKPISVYDVPGIEKHQNFLHNGTLN